MVWFVSSSLLTVNVGSSSASLDKALANFSSSAFDFGSIATEITGSGNSIDSKITGFASSQSVSPVPVFFKPTTAAISPALTSLISSLLFECILTIREILSLLFLPGLNT